MIIGKFKDEVITSEMLKIKYKNIDLRLDNFVKSSIMTTIAGYKKIQNFLINSVSINPKDYFQKFLSYVLNNRKYAPIEYKLNIEYNGKNEKSQVKNNHFDCVILFSGGFDSTSLLFHALDKGLNPLLLWVGFGQKNQKEELNIVKKVSKKLEREFSIITLDLSKYIQEGWKDWDFIIPCRNFMFASFAASILSNSSYKKSYIYTGVHEEEYLNKNTDKSPRYFRSCNKLFKDNYNKDIIIDTPFKKTSKTELAAHWKNVWFKKYNIKPFSTISCYYGSNCGKCNACLKRSMSLVASGWGLDPDIKIHPFSSKSDIINEYIIKRVLHFPKKRRDETLLAIKKEFPKVSPEVKKFFTSLPTEIKNEVFAYEFKLNNLKLSL